MDIDDIDNEEEKGQEEEAVDIDGDNIFAGGYLVANEPEDTVNKSRTYDLSITYDLYHQTPRLWLMGYDENGKVLEDSQVFEDVMGDYAKKTVTIDPHPHTNIRQISIHPCNHAKVMKKLIDTQMSNGVTAQVHLSMFLFLKFIQSVVPTIEYDFTVDFELGE